MIARISTPSKLPCHSVSSVVEKSLLAPCDFRVDADNDRSDQSIGFCPSASSSALILENGRLPKNPLFADSGEGCGAVMIAWRVRSEEHTSELQSRENLVC